MEIKDNWYNQNQVNPIDPKDQKYDNTSIKEEFDNDPWKHRSTQMSCSTCMYYVPKKTSIGIPNKVEIGRCRRNAPTMKGYPAVFSTDWCGEHKVDEEKLLLG